MGQRVPATVSGLATCLWPLAVSTPRKELHTEEAGTWEDVTAAAMAGAGALCLG